MQFLLDNRADANVYDEQNPGTIDVTSRYKYQYWSIAVFPVKLGVNTSGWYCGQETGKEESVD
jgi:hypothetical protein